MLIGMDVSRLQGPRTGVARHEEYLLRSWSRAMLPFEELFLFSREPVDDLPRSPQLRPSVLPSRHDGIVWQATRLRTAARAVDLLFGSYTLPPGYRGLSAVTNLGVYGGKYADPAEGTRGRLRTRHIAWSARRAALVLANSETTKRDVVEHCGVDPAKIVLVQPGLGSEFRDRGDIDRRPPKLAADLVGPDGQYFLFVGKLSARRHVPDLIAALGRLRAESRPHLLLVGPNTTKVAVDELALAAGVPDKVHHIPFLDLVELASLYRAARAFLMPTEREGFGHPVVEAWGCSCPVLVLKDAGLGALDWFPEKARAAVLTAADGTADGLGMAMQRLAEDDALVEELRRRGGEIAVNYPTWDTHAAATMHILWRLAKARPVHRRTT
jgi:glycosyltransferase involved in cell wall biosynthesis